MRTTVAIDDELLKEAKRRAQANGVSLGSVIEDALRRELTVQVEVPAPELPVFRGGTGPLPGVDVDSNRAVAERLDRDRDLEQLR